MVKKAMFMEGQIPKGGACISSFIVAEKDGEVLLGKMSRPEIWVERFLVGSASRQNTRLQESGCYPRRT